MLFAPRERARLIPFVGDDAVLRANAPLRQALDETQGLDPINRVSYLESRCYMLNTLLRDSDFMSMAHGLEVRVPLIDHQLAEQVMTLPGKWKVGGETPKRLLVGAMNGALPDSIVRRSKRGFTLPFEHWMRDALRSEVEGAMTRIDDGKLGRFLNSSGAHAVFDDFLRGATSWSRPWSLFVLQRWCEQHL
jgi:asparagine synthase (glutamine-hydrolysing)